MIGVDDQTCETCAFRHIYILYMVFASTISILMILMDVYCIYGIVIDKYGGWLRNPPPKGWLKFYKSWDKPYVWYMYVYIWLVLWNHGILWLSIQLGISSSQLIFNFSEGLRPPTSINMYVYIYIYCIWFKSTISIWIVLMDVFGIYGIVIDKWWVKFWGLWDHIC